MIARHGREKVGKDLVVAEKWREVWRRLNEGEEIAIKLKETLRWREMEWNGVEKIWRKR